MYIIINENFSKIERQVTEQELREIAQRQNVTLEFTDLGVYCNGILIAVQ